MARDRSAVGVLVASDRAVVPPTPAFRQPAGLQRWLARHLLDVVLVAPLFLYVLFFMLIPVVQSIYLSFTIEGAGQPTIDNYRTVINRSQFRDAFVKTLG